MTEKPNPRGRPSKPIPKLDASPEKIARAVFSAVKKPNSNLRIARKRTAAARLSMFGNWRAGWVIPLSSFSNNWMARLRFSMSRTSTRRL